MGTPKKVPYGSIVSIFAIIAVGTIGLIARQNLLYRELTFCCEITFSVFWVIRLIVWIIRRHKTETPRAAWWLLEAFTIAIAVLLILTPAHFFTRFILNRHSLVQSVKQAQTEAQTRFNGNACSVYQEIANDGQWFIDNTRNRNSGQFRVRQTVVSKSGNVLIVTGMNDEFTANEGIYYTRDRKFIDYYKVVGTSCSFEIGCQDRFIHFFGPWYYWENY